MKTTCFYHKDSGLFHGMVLMADDDVVALNTPPDHLAIDGEHDVLSKRVDVSTGAVVDHQPPQPSPDHEWNADTKRWQLTAAATDRVNRRAAAIARIAHLESSQHRAVREILLGRLGASARLQAIDDEISSLRSQV